MCNSSTPEAEAEGSLVKNRQDKKERKEEREEDGVASHFHIVRVYEDPM